MSDAICGSTATRSGKPCQRGPNCPHHHSGLSHRKKRALELLEAGKHKRGEVAKACGVTRRTLYNWLDKHEELQQAAEIGKRAQYETIRDNWFQRLKEGECSAAEMIFYLKNTRPDEWSDMRRTEITGSDGGPVEVDVRDAREQLYRQLSQLAAREDALQGVGTTNGGPDRGDAP